jgi:hypothetical protein
VRDQGLGTDEAVADQVGPGEREVDDGVAGVFLRAAVGAPCLSLVQDEVHPVTEIADGDIEGDVDVTLSGQIGGGRAQRLSDEPQHLLERRARALAADGERGQAQGHARRKGVLLPADHRGGARPDPLQYRRAETVGDTDVLLRLPGFGDEKTQRPEFRALFRLEHTVNRRGVERIAEESVIG